MALSQHQLDELDTQGWTVLPDVLQGERLQQVVDAVEALYESEGENAGSEFRTEQGSRRLANLLDKGEIFRDLIETPDVLEAAHHVLGDGFKISSFNARSANPHNGESQPLHVDNGSLPDERGYSVFNSSWLLDDFTTRNGPTRAVPGSHDSGQIPQQVLADAKAPHPDEVLITGPAGAVVLMNTHAWHGGTANQTDKPRRALHAFFCRNDIPQQQYQKRLLSPETQAALSPTLRRVTAIDDPLNDQVSSSEERSSGFLQ